MRIAAVICEFNPFHYGHKYLLDEIKNKGFDTIICIMSGSFTQRGEVAIYDKFSRAKAALRNGADIVIELPAVYSVASAEKFAKGGVEIIANLKVADAVFFGSESGDIELIKKASLATKDAKVLKILADYMNQGDYYPLALNKAVNNVYGKDISDVLSKPNNILGVEYIKELSKYNIKADTICRKGTQHDSNISQGEFASASLIREMIFKGQDISPFIPGYSEDLFSNPAATENGERAVLYKLKSISIDELEKLADVTEGLENRIYSAARESSSLEEFMFKVKTKRYTMARIRRITTSALLGITKDLQSMPIKYIRVLGMTDNGKKAMSHISAKSSLPIVTKVSTALQTLDDNAKRMLMCDINATDIRTVFESEISECGKDFTTAIIKE